MLSEKLIRELLSNSLVVDLTEIKLTQLGTDTPQIRRGPGTVTQLPSGGLELKVFLNHQVDFGDSLMLSFQTPAGQLLTDRDYFRMEAIDYGGQEWKCDNDDLAVYPAGRSIDPGLLTLLRAQLADPKSPLRSNSVSRSNVAGLVVDLNADGREDFVLFVDAVGHVYQQTGTTWSHVGVVDTKDYTAKATDVRAALSDRKFTTELLEWRDLKIGKYRFRFSPGNGIGVDQDE